MAANGAGAGAGQPFPNNQGDMARALAIDLWSFYITPNDPRRDESAQLDDELRSQQGVRYQGRTGAIPKMTWSSITLKCGRRQQSVHGISGLSSFLLEVLGQGV